MNTVVRDLTLNEIPGLSENVNAARQHGAAGRRGDEFDRTDRGVIAASSLDNIRLALSRLCVRLAYDSFANHVLVNDVPLSDVILDQTWTRIDDVFHFRPSKAVLETVIKVDARASSRHPVREYLERLRWDGTRRLHTWLTDYAGAVDTPYVRAVSALPLIAAVRRVRQPGVKFDELLVLESPQGSLKSTALQTLCPKDDWFSDDLPLGVDSKHIIERTAGKWIIEAAELHGNRGRESEQLKAFLSRRVDGPVRLAYDRLPTSVPRQFVMIGTTNATSSYLKDMTGARRFWPVTIQRFAVEALVRDRDQLWSEAASVEASGVSIRLDPSLWAAAAVEQEDRRASDPWEETLESVFADAEDGRVPVAMIWSVLGVTVDQRDNRVADRIACIAQRCGFTTKRKMRVDGRSPVWHWVRSDRGEA